MMSAWSHDNSAKGAFMPNAGVEVKPTRITRRVLESFEPREREALSVYYLRLRNSRTVKTTFEFTEEEFNLLRQEQLHAL